MDPEFLNLIGIEGEELNKEVPRLEKAFGILRIVPEDIGRAKERVSRIFSMELRGMRKIWGIAVKELVDLILAKEEGKKVAYGSYPPLSELLVAGSLASEDIYCSPAEAVVDMVLSPMFGPDKVVPILETAERHGLAPNLAACSFLKTRLGAIVNGIVPIPDLLLSFCFLCDQTPKTDEVLHDLYGVPVAYVDNIFEDNGHGWPEDISQERVEYFANEIRCCAEKFSQVMEHELTEEKVREAVALNANVFRAAADLREFMKADPVPLSQSDFMMISRAVYSATRRGSLEGIEALTILSEEVKKRVNEGVGPVAKGAPRVLLTNAPMDPSPLVTVIEGLGLAIPATSLASAPTKGTPRSYDSIWEHIAYTLMRRRGAYHSSWGWILQLKELASVWNVDGLIIFVHLPCRQYELFPLKAKEVIKKEIGIPVVIIEGDYVDLRDYNAQQTQTRLETFAELLKGRK
jgi:benzoyl-CoA reductase/2-hydroxyglutaryl-CoA dehydratase subunit BcrC/BadD/HgdB